MGADVETRVNTRYLQHGTALHIVAMENHLEIAKLLIEYGANVYAKNAQNKLPVDLLPQKEGNFFELLVQSAAQPVVLQDLCRRQIRAALGSNILKFLPNFNIPRRLRLYLMHRAELNICFQK
ncbi:ankyrin repeat and SOCS box protein 13 [Caerostris extrusa]|uniref:Ankyrin repeat and SOCS box protein 13 n=1 Tax=Caerostris extrusa TaxID=172846 RepID=A0AAV4NF79_CAEEX|nr:ankyrin repeat and SOCS box protein 13 [Caerostris extrusa]